MAYYLTEKNALIFHIPKCGGFWLQEAILRAGLSVRHIPHPLDDTRADRHALPRHVCQRAAITAGVLASGKPFWPQRRRLQNAYT